jgi:hypothetical protein
LLAIDGLSRQEHSFVAFNKLNVSAVRWPALRSAANQSVL